MRDLAIELGEIERAINSHPEIRESVVVLREEMPAAERLTAYVVTGGETENLITGAWHSQWEGVHSQGIEASEAEGSTQTPTSAYLRGMRLADQERQVREFDVQTLARIRAMHPTNILEIGGGTGNLALALAPECEHYVLTDFSRTAVDYLRARAPGNVTILEQEAADFRGIEAAAFDIVVLHSVCQYFPSAAYLIRVIEGMVRATRPGGRIYVGDVQSFSLLEAFHRGKQAQSAPESLPLADLLERVRRNVAREMELVADPGFFNALQRRIPTIQRVECQLRRGHVLNEVTKFHYDVTLHIAEAAEALAPARWLDWRGADWDLESLRRELNGTRSEVLGLRNVPNARVQWEIAALAEFGAAMPPATAGELCARVNQAIARHPGVDPEDIWSSAANAGYAAAINWSSDAAGADGDLEVILHRIEGVPVFPVARGGEGKPPDAFANRPLQPSGERGREEGAGGRVDLILATRLGCYLKDRLPEDMVPSTFVPLTRLPLTPEGKVDRGALPVPVYAAALGTTAAPDSPNTRLEKYLAALWCNVLGIERIGIHDNFFASGGDSLLGVRMINRLRESLCESLSLVVIFEAPTILALAGRLEADHAAAVARLCSFSGSGSGDPGGLEPGESAIRAAAGPGSEPARLIPAVARETHRIKRSALGSGSEVRFASRVRQ